MATYTSKRNRKLTRKYTQLAKALYPTLQIYYATQDYCYTINTLSNDITVRFITHDGFVNLTLTDTTRAVASLVASSYGSVEVYRKEFASYIQVYNMIIQT